MERRYISPEMDIIEFDTNDVITTSSDLGGEKPGLTDVIDVNGIKKATDALQGRALKLFQSATKNQQNQGK